MENITTPNNYAAAENQNMYNYSNQPSPAQAYSPFAHTLEKCVDLIKEGATKLETDNPGLCKNIFGTLLITAGTGFVAAGIITIVK